MTVWFNGAFVASGPVIAPGDRGFLLGDGAFETILVRNGACAFLAAHCERLRAGLATLRIPAPPGLDGLPAVVAALAARNGLDGLAAARATVSRGPGARGLALIPQAEDARPSMLVSLAPYAPPAGAARLAVSARRRFSGAAATRFKAIGGYLDNMLAHDEALAAGADEAILLNERGDVACAASANVFVLGDDGTLATPRCEDGAMPGVVRAEILSLARKAGLEAAARRVAPGELEAGFVFLTNSLAGLRPAHLGATPGAPPEVFHRLQSCYHQRLEENFEQGKPVP